jgi:hypothetical protein
VKPGPERAVFSLTTQPTDESIKMKNILKFVRFFEDKDEEE